MTGSNPEADNMVFRIIVNISVQFARLFLENIKMCSMFLSEITF